MICSRRSLLLAGAALATGSLPLRAQSLPVVRLGLLEYGTSQWEMAVVERLQLDHSAGVQLRIVPFAVKEAASVALQAQAVDAILTDWIWVARQRAMGRDFVFAPYSRMVGGIVVRPDAQIKSLHDMQGKKLGVAGGGLDKSWLLLRAYARNTVGRDAAEWLAPSFAAPPLLNALLLKGELPAVLTFWHFAARLRAAGMTELLTIEAILAGLGLDTDVPMLGWAFSRGWARRHPAAIEGLLAASSAAKRELIKDDQLWRDLRPLLRVDDEATAGALRNGYRDGAPGDNIERAEASAGRVFDVLARLGGTALVGPLTKLPDGLFWKGGSAS